MINVRPDIFKSRKDSNPPPPPPPPPEGPDLRSVHESFEREESSDNTDD